MTHIHGDGSSLGDDRPIWSNAIQADAGPIDMGPFLRQEGRIPSRKPPSSKAALRAKLGLSDLGLANTLMARRRATAARSATVAEAGAVDFMARAHGPPRVTASQCR